MMLSFSCRCLLTLTVLLIPPSLTTAEIHFTTLDWNHIEINTPVNITWQSTSPDSPFDLALYHGPIGNMQFVRNITQNHIAARTGRADSFYTWTPLAFNIHGNYSLIVSQLNNISTSIRSGMENGSTRFGIETATSPRFELHGAVVRGLSILPSGVVPFLPSSSSSSSSSIPALSSLPSIAAHITTFSRSTISSHATKTKLPLPGVSTAPAPAAPAAAAELIHHPPGSLSTPTPTIRPRAAIKSPSFSDDSGETPTTDPDMNFRSLLSSLIYDTPRLSTVSAYTARDGVVYDVIREGCGCAALNGGKKGALRTVVRSMTVENGSVGIATGRVPLETGMVLTGDAERMRMRLCSVLGMAMVSSILIIQW